MPARLINLAGQRFGDLTVTALSPIRSSSGGARWRCVCVCGTETEVAASDLRKHRSGQIMSCGCRRNEAGEKNRTHGQSNSPEYAVWSSMKDRCTRSSHPHYSRYGGRGIGVCERWMDSFESFLSDVGPRPHPAASLDRIDNDRGYEPGNCRWATPSEQAANRVSTNIIEHNGQRMCKADWARKLGITPQSLSRRIREWGLERALTETRHGV